LRRAQILVVQKFDQRRRDFAQVVRRDVGGHADRDACCAVHEQIGQPRRQHHRLGLRAVVVGTERHRGLLDFAEDLVADAREPAFGVAHGGGVVAVERSEVTRSVHQRIAEREGLCHTNERLVQRGVAVRVITSHHVAHHFRALPVLDVCGQVLLPHRVQDAALHRFQTVAHIGERTRGDDGQRVVEVPRLRGFVQRDRLLTGAAAMGIAEGRPAAAFRCRV
jgi:hypothetical protein